MAISVSSPRTLASGCGGTKSKWTGLLQMRQKEKEPKQQRALSSSTFASESRVAQASQDQRRPSRKYSRSGQVLGTGANSSVELVRRHSDGGIFAVKRFRSRTAVETDREHLQKIVGEFRVGSLLHHGNVIQTLELYEEDGQWHQVMEYAPHDLFEAVLSREMSSEEIRCSFMQIVNGVSYLHRLGLAHRDLKLENVVVTERGIMKIVDFGCAALCRDPDTKKQIYSTDIVGCSSYMAPEILQRRPYDPQCADVWSLGIMYCCMVLGRFPWKIALPSVDAYKRFATSQLPKTNIQAGDEEESFEKTVVSTSFEKVSKEGDKAIVIQTSMLVERQKGETDPVEGSSALLKTLPAESRLVIGGMLQVLPQRRSSLQQICDDAWVKQSDICSQDGRSNIRCSGEHRHTLRGR